MRGGSGYDGYFMRNLKEGGNDSITDPDGDGSPNESMTVCETSEEIHSFAFSLPQITEPVPGEFHLVAK